jgi:Holliday junction DNA helicase RuvA
MIAYIEGKITHKEPAYVVVEAGGIGYEVRISLNTYEALKEIEQTKLLTHLHIKEDAHTLYGFMHAAERKLFLDLIGISGVGPSTGMVILSSMPSEDIKSAIINGDAATLQRIKGIGAKTAQRIVLELRDKLAKETEGAVPSDYVGQENNKATKEALSALITLGINKAAAEKSIFAIVKKHGRQITVEEIIKLALKTS